MADNYVPNLGELCKDDARRDAVHVACAPVIAGQDLHPGEHVYLDERKMARYDFTVTEFKSIGIVDPFLKQDVKKGERFWLFLYPGTITGLRHMWSHPAFNDAVLFPAPKKTSED